MRGLRIPAIPEGVRWFLTMCYGAKVAGSLAHLGQGIATGQPPEPIVEVVFCFGGALLGWLFWNHWQALPPDRPEYPERPADPPPPTPLFPPGNGPTGTI